VPIDPDRCDEFDPFDVPTLESLMEEMDAYEQQHKSEDISDVRGNHFSLN